MRRFLPTVSLLLYAVTSQAAPMANGQNPGSAQSASRIPNQESAGTRIPNPAPAPPSPPQPPPQPINYQPGTIAPTAPYPTQPSQYYFCPPHYEPCQARCQPCPSQCQPYPPHPEPTQSPHPQPTEPPRPQSTEPPPKKTGWRNAFYNAFTYVSNFVYEALAGETGFFTNLGNAPPPKFNFGSKRKKSKPRPASAGASYACCSPFSSPPPVQDDDDDDGTTINVPNVINCIWSSTRTTSSAPAAAAAAVSGAHTKTRNTDAKCFLVGEKLINVKNFIKGIIKPQFNCCACAANVSVIEKV